MIDEFLEFLALRCWLTEVMGIMRTMGIMCHTFGWRMNSNLGQFNKFLFLAGVAGT
jgi:hypothetical protein